MLKVNGETHAAYLEVRDDLTGATTIEDEISVARLDLTGGDDQHIAAEETTGVVRGARGKVCCPKVAHYDVELLAQAHGVASPRAMTP